MPINNIQGPFTRINYEKVKVTSSQQVKKFLLDSGWKPTTYNRVFDSTTRTWRTTSPKLTEDSFGTIAGNTGKLVARRNIIAHRRRTLINPDDPDGKGILSKVRSIDGRVPAEGILCATPTSRTAHRGAVCNVPKSSDSVVYGKEMRSIFCVKPPYVMLGADLAQIEARITAHYASKFDGGAYWDVINSVDDIHQHNADTISSSRDVAKSFQYALFFGARAPKLATIIGCSVKEAEVHVDSFWENNSGIYYLVEYLKKFLKKHGYIVGLDGRRLIVRAEYKLLNTLIQSAAAIIFKRWSVIAQRRLCDLDCNVIISYHDELDFRCYEDLVDVSTEIIKKSSLDSGRYYNLYTPITVDVKVGYNWSEVH